MGDVFLRRLSRWQAEQYREQLADLHGAAYGSPPGEALRDRAPFLEQLADASGRPGFDLVLADGGGPVGCAYGYPAARDSALWRDFAGPVPEELEELTAAGRVFVLAELMVLPRHRRQGLGRRLHDRLLSGSGAALAAVVLAPMDARSQAVRAARRSWGWAAAGTLRPAAPGGPAPEVFTRPLRR
ncbi:GNAT family N-acetyltransferase [Streptomyces sp. HU2014]|uniref:GNAT family N-acetyltransferase n=1 Tax=Streptomyces sp. HU2014 TaxID=2939414 RepID=UPI0020106788|nr:GNAT family N-acetyltransferase [Streptomyces sp. HU2014]UQI49056.1 GNAT family N-acetyltransferase [Streptomyces sp. HU2014]